ncbi:MAG TPA: phosphoenolpyruvate synthase [Candidatus Bathyarchaeia archaeon]|nr:phosphoenolpyruvate synthase [Candidatus Bathyarchaeia archaeon]
MKDKQTIVWLEDVRIEDVPSVGGKGASLGEMISAEIPVPRGFAVTAQAFRRFLDETGITAQLFATLRVNVDDPKELEAAADGAKKLVMKATMPQHMRSDITQAYNELAKREGKEPLVAVRSSATAEDMPEASFAGQQETFLNVRGGNKVVEAVQKCWASLYGARAIFYRVKQGFDHESVNISAVVQKMVNADKSGVMFTSNPTTGAPEAIIEGSWGLGEAIVSGSVSPDTYIIDRSTRQIKANIATKAIMVVRDQKTGATVTEDVPGDLQNKRVLSDSELYAILDLGELIEEHYESPQDIEWAIEQGEVYIVQSRPVTTIKQAEKAGVTTTAGEAEKLLEGLGASPGQASGQVRIIRSVDELDRVLDGDILVTAMTSPDMVPAMRRAAAIVTDEGGLTSHAAIVSRELGVPAVVGTKEATKKLTDGTLITVDGEKGLIFAGRLERAAAGGPGAGAAARAVAKPVTATEVKVNVSIAEATDRAVATEADGVGLLRVEHMIIGMGKHPHWYIEHNEKDTFIRELEKGIRTVVDAFFPRSVWVRTLDAPTDEFRQMEGGEEEPIEPNPMLGWRGIRRDLQDVEVFKMQLQTFKNLIDDGYTNIGIMLPLVQHQDEVREAKRVIGEVGIDFDRVDVGIMIEIPASALIIDDLIAEGIDFVSFGTNDLTQYTLAVDRNNENVAALYNEQHPAVLKLMDYVIQRCNKAGVMTSICGQAGSNPKMADKLVRMGISSISSNIDAVERVRDAVARTEMRILLEASRDQTNDA